MDNDPVSFDMPQCCGHFIYWPQVGSGKMSRLMRSLPGGSHPEEQHWIGKVIRIE